jgi:hypothetical protein
MAGHIRFGDVEFRLARNGVVPRNVSADEAIRRTAEKLARVIATDD